VPDTSGLTLKVEATWKEGKQVFPPHVFEHVSFVAIEFWCGQHHTKVLVSTECGVESIGRSDIGIVATQLTLDAYDPKHKLVDQWEERFTDHVLERPEKLTVELVTGDMHVLVVFGTDGTTSFEPICETYSAKFASEE